MISVYLYWEHCRCREYNVMLAITLHYWRFLYSQRGTLGLKASIQTPPLFYNLVLPTHNLWNTTLLMFLSLGFCAVLKLKLYNFVRSVDNQSKDYMPACLLRNHVIICKIPEYVISFWNYKLCENKKKLLDFSRIKT